ncbi:MAG: hypothetical protein LBI33_02725 [Propionibacteriaceae bacterium]|jgi:hypothetical protein|nr:hypothetical protein [Propionibacteriaceae bacterium]
MPRVLKGVFIGLGIVLIAATALFMTWDVIQINTLAAVANANKSPDARTAENPRLWVILAAVAALVSGLILGLGLGWPGRGRAQGDPAQPPA